MFDPRRHFERLVELETRQDDVLRELDELNDRVEQVIAGCATDRTAEPASSSATLD
jgi:hypothetical protein